MCHFETRSSKTALDIEPLIRFRAIENGLRRQYQYNSASLTQSGRRKKGTAHLIASHLLSHIIQRLNNPQPEFLALLILGDGDILNMSHEAQLMYTISPGQTTSVPRVSLSCKSFVCIDN